MRSVRILLPVLVLCLVAVVTALAQGSRKSAWRLEPRQGAFEGVNVEVMESAPPQFALQLGIEMPTPGWKLATDEVAKPDESGRIVVRATATGPDGMVPQVITPGRLRVVLGHLDAGDYLVEVHLRRGEGTYRREAAILLEATGR